MWVREKREVAAFTALGWVDLAGFQVTVMELKGRLTDWLHGLDGLIWSYSSTSFHFLSSVRKNWSDRANGRQVCECVRASACTVWTWWVHVWLYIRVRINGCGSFHRNIHLHSSLASHQLPACPALPSLVLTWAPVLVHWRAHVLFWPDVAAVYESKAAAPQSPLPPPLKLSSASEHSPKTSAFWKRFTDELNSQCHLSPCLLSLFASLFFTLFGTPPSLNLGKLRGTPNSFMYMTIGLLWMVLKLTDRFLYGW